MVDEKIRDYTANYQVKLDTESNEERSKFVTISDLAQDIPPITVHSINDEIYSVRFLNNEFFEEPEQTLWHSLSAILAGRYRIKKVGFIFKKLSIMVDVPEGGEVLPERIYSSKEFAKIYHTLPRPFSTHNVQNS